MDRNEKIAAGIVTAIIVGNAALSATFVLKSRKLMKKVESKRSPIKTVAYITNTLTA